MSITDFFKRLVGKNEKQSDKSIALDKNNHSKNPELETTEIWQRRKAAENDWCGYYLDEKRLKNFIKNLSEPISTNQVLRDFHNYCVAKSSFHFVIQNKSALNFFETVFACSGEVERISFHEIINRQSAQIPFSCSSDDLSFLYLSSETAKKMVGRYPDSDENDFELRKMLSDVVEHNRSIVLFALDVQYAVIRGFVYGLGQSPYLIRRILEQDPIIEHRASFSDERLRRLIDVVKSGIPVREELKAKLNEVMTQSDSDLDEEIRQAAMPYKDQKKIQIYYDDSERWDGFSHMGGYPRFPASMNVPCGRNGEPMPLLAQIRCSSLPQGTSLPDNGYLYFFYDATEGGSGDAWGHEKNDDDSWKVIYSQGAPLEKEQIYDSYRIFKNKKIIFALENAYPDDVYEHGSFHANAVHPEIYAHQMLGGPWILPVTSCSDTLPSTRCTEMTKAPEDTEWVMLLQIGTEEGTCDAIHWTWGDCGQLAFWIRKDDLAARNFSRVWLLIGDQ